MVLRAAGSRRWWSHVPDLDQAEPVARHWTVTTHSTEGGRRERARRPTSYSGAPLSELQPLHTGHGQCMSEETVGMDRGWPMTGTNTPKDWPCSGTREGVPPGSASAPNIPKTRRHLHLRPPLPKATYS